MSKEKTNKTFIGIFALMLVSTLMVTNVYGQITGKKIGCKDEDMTYTYDGGVNKDNISCGVSWTVEDGVFPDHGNNIIATTFTDGATGKSSIKVKWNKATHNGMVKVGSNCPNGPRQIDGINIWEVSLGLSASATTINLGQKVTLKASSNDTPTYEWSSPASGFLDSKTGSQVTASPNSTATYTCTATVNFIINSGTPFTCKQANTIKINVNVPGISGNAICCDQCIRKGGSPSPLGQAAGETLKGGNGTAFTFQWFKSTDGSNFASIAGATSEGYSPQELTETTFYRRQVGAGTSISQSNIIKIETILSTMRLRNRHYTENETVKAFDILSIEGSQTIAPDIHVDFVSESQVVVSPSENFTPVIISCSSSASATLKIGQMCASSSNGRIATAGNELALTQEETTLSKGITVDDNITSSEASDVSIFPNPTHGETSITYMVSKKGPVTLYVTDYVGQLCEVLVDENSVEPGQYITKLQLKNKLPGIYICTLITNGVQKTRRLTILQ
jgi:hypothetical protein